MASGKTLLFVVTEDWFFVSHFLSVAVAARKAGFDVSVAVRLRDPEMRRRIEAAGVRVVASAHERGHFGPLAMLRHTWAFAALFRAERPDVIHLISVRLIVIAGFGALLAGRRRRVHAVTGLGLMGASTTSKARAARAVIGWLLRGPLGGTGIRTVFENREDPATLGMDPDGPRVRVVGGAGIDPTREAGQPLPPIPPLKVAVVARMVHSKGVDVAVEAVRRARAAGADVELSLVGAPDPENLRSIPESQLHAWAEEPGIAWLGHRRDVSAIWREHHVVCVPSRGGEGLPRSLLEGAAAARAVVTTATPGCATFARDGVEGYVVPPGDPKALADALADLARDPALLARFAKAARARVLDGFTTEHVARAFVEIYSELAAPGR